MANLYHFWIADLNKMGSMPERSVTGNRRQAERTLKDMLRPYKRPGDRWQWDTTSQYSSFDLDVLHIVDRMGARRDIVGALKTTY